LLEGVPKLRPEAEVFWKRAGDAWEKIDD
jgi:hypothetical protein